jgi:flagellar hook-length control protein FliK
MNVNLSPSSDSSKVKSGSISESVKAGKSDDSEGLFSKLAALIMGEDKKPTDKSQSKVAADDKVSVVKVSKEDDAIDSAVDSDVDSAVADIEEGQLAGKELTAKVPSSDLVDPSSQFDEAELSMADQSESLSRDGAAQLMSSGDEVLGRLKGSNQALQSASGKELPPLSSDGVATLTDDEIAQTAVLASAAAAIHSSADAQVQRNGDQVSQEMLMESRTAHALPIELSEDSNLATELDDELLLNRFQPSAPQITPLPPSAEEGADSLSVDEIVATLTDDEIAQTAVLASAAAAIHSSADAQVQRNGDQVSQEMLMESRTAHALPIELSEDSNLATELDDELLLNRFQPSAPQITPLPPSAEEGADSLSVDEMDGISDEILLAALASGSAQAMLTNGEAIAGESPTSNVEGELANAALADVAVTDVVLTEEQRQTLAAADITALTPEQRADVLSALDSGRIPANADGELIRQLAGKPIIMGDSSVLAAEFNSTFPPTWPIDNERSEMVAAELGRAGITNEKLAEGKLSPSVQQALGQQSAAQQAMNQQHQASLAANLHQQMQAERVAAAVTNPSAIPVDPSAVLNQPMSAAQLAAVNQGNDISTAKTLSMAGGVLGAKSLLGDNSRESTKGTESNFASQLSHLTGQQGSSLAAIKAEVQQTPVHINKEASADQMAEKVNMMMSKNLKNIDIRLDPPELGKMQIRMNMNGDMTTVHFTVANQHARDAIEQSMPRLREMLSQQGVQLGETAVQQQHSQQQGGYAASGRGQSNGSAESNLVGTEQNVDGDVKVDLNLATKRDGISFYA